MEQRTITRHPRTFRDGSHAAEAACASPAGARVEWIAVAFPTAGARALAASPPRGGRPASRFSSPAGVTFSRPEP
jgi:hypothetical protein